MGKQRTRTEEVEERRPVPCKYPWVHWHRDSVSRDTVMADISLLNPTTSFFILLFYISNGVCESAPLSLPLETERDALGNTLYAEDYSYYLAQITSVAREGWAA